MKVQFRFEWRSITMGIAFPRGASAIFIYPLPMIIMTIVLPPKPPQ